jgi:hypothetical protein
MDTTAADVRREGAAVRMFSLDVPVSCDRRCGREVGRTLESPRRPFQAQREISG